MSKPNYKEIAALKLREFLDISSEYSFGEVLYSVLRKIEKPKNCNVGFIKDLDDEIFYAAIEKAIKEEKQEQAEWI